MNIPSTGRSYGYGLIPPHERRLIAPALHALECKRFLLCHFTPNIISFQALEVHNLGGKSLPLFFGVFDFCAHGTQKARMSRCVRCEYRASLQTICRFRKTVGRAVRVRKRAVGRSGGSPWPWSARPRCVTGRSGRGGRAETCKLFLLRSLLASDAPAHPCFLCVMSGNFKSPKRTWHEFAPKIVDAHAP